MASRTSFVTLGWFCMIAAVLIVADCTCGGVIAAKKIIREPRRFTFEIAANTPVKDLLPTPPKDWPMLPGYLCEKFEQMAEVTFGEQVAKGSDTEKETAHLLAKINHVNRNRKDDDAFMKALAAHRPELRGLPFLMGKECRTDVKRAQVFSEAVELVHRCERALRADAYVVPDAYWPQFRSMWAEKDPDVKSYRHEVDAADAEQAQVRALMQIMAPTPEVYRVGLAKYLATIHHVEAAQALTRLALYAPEDNVRQAAIDALKQRGRKDYADLLLDGFRYPMPAASQRAAEALVKLDARETLAKLVDVLEQPDPRAPVKQEVNGREEKIVRELVRINHHQNCLLCHAPANGNETPRDVLTAAVPLPDRSLGSVSSGYRFDTSPDIFIRLDRTYLRQDFSLLMRVENASPWPEMQRFDFLVRTRVLTVEEADACEKYLSRRTPPNHAAAQFALRTLTGLAPAESTPRAWRRAIESLR